MISRKNKISLMAVAFYTGLPCIAMAQQYKVKDSVTIAISPVYDSVSKAHRFFFGESYRKLWATPVKLRIINLQKE
jgi:hypothetical protein